MVINNRFGCKNIFPIISIIFLLFNASAYAYENSGHVSQPAEHKLVSLPQIRPWTGDLDGMLKRRTIRILVPYSKTLFFIDKGRQFGVEAELGRQLEVWLNKRHKVKTLGLHVAFIPTTRDSMTEALVTGKGDILAANLTITPERLEKVDFTIPWLNEVHEILIQGKDSPKKLTKLRILPEMNSMFDALAVIILAL
jgi:ABC-type amino acid transport substrate-binding protein